MRGIRKMDTWSIGCRVSRRLLLRLRGGLLEGGFGGRLGGWSRGHAGVAGEFGFFYGVKLGPLGVGVLFATLFDGVLIHAGAVAVLVVEHFDDVHAFAVDEGKGREALGVERGIVFEIDEELRGAGGGAGSGKDDRSLFIALRVRVV